MDTYCPRRRPCVDRPHLPTRPDRAVMTQVCPPGESVYLSGVVSNRSARILPNHAFAAQPQNSRSDFWIDDSGTSCHMTNDASKMYCVRPRPLDQRGAITSDGIRVGVECIGHIDMLFHGRSEEQITLIDVSNVPDLKFNFYMFHKVQQTHVIILNAAGAHIREENLTFPFEKSGSCLRSTRLVPGTVGAKPRTNRALASQISAPPRVAVCRLSPRVFRTAHGFRVRQRFRGPMQCMVICWNRSPLPP